MSRPLDAMDEVAVIRVIAEHDLSLVLANDEAHEHDRMHFADLDRDLRAAGYEIVRIER